MVVRGRRCPILVVHDQGRVFAMDNRCPHLGFPLHRGSIADGILTCHWHHARFDLASGCTFDLWADDVPTFPVELHDGEIWVKDGPGHADPAAHWRRRLDDGLAHNLSLVIAKSVQGLLAAGVPPAEILRQAALFGARNRDGWGIGLTILTALGNLLPLLPAEETYLALFHGLRRVAADCEDQPPRRDRAPLAPAPGSRRSSGGCATGVPCATATAPSAPCLRRSRPARHRTPWPTSCSRPRPTACLPTAATRSISSTRRSSASI